LIELNTFAHCISAFFIYAFWWHKPYEVETHIYIHHPEFLQSYLLSKIRGGAHWLVDAGGEKHLFGEYSIFEKTPDGQVSTVDSSMRYDEYLHPFENERIFRRKLESGARMPGTRIPGTEFFLFQWDVPHDDRPDLTLSYITLDFWKRLWRLRCNAGLQSQSDYEIPSLSYSNVHRRAKNLDREFEDSAVGDAGVTVPLILTSAFLVYGGVHLLAWEYNFQTNTEGIMWRTASIITASSGLIIFLAQTLKYLDESRSNMRVWVFFGFLFCVEILARSFLVIESFRALPNSPSSVYEMPRWTAYLPHV
jgi:hypothetical protein